MLFENSTYTENGILFSQLLRVSLVVSLCIASTLGNTFLLLIFYQSVRNTGSKSHRYRVIDIILAFLALTALSRGLLLGPIQAACFITGEWYLGESFCQFQAFIETTLRNCYIWYLGLLSIERYTRYILPHDYLATFSPLTGKVILPGILLIVIVNVTGPLYGWGRYHYVTDAGLCNSAVMSPYGCSYAIYLVIFLFSPPVSAIAVNGLLLSSRMCKRGSKATTKRNISAGNSHILNAEKEILSLVLLMSLFVLLSVPRSVTELVVMCRGIYELDSRIIFTIYFSDSLTTMLLPLLCLGMHSHSRTILWKSFLSRNLSSADLDMATLNV